MADFFGQTPLTNLDPDKVVALGAAIQANVLAGNRAGDDWLLLDVIPLSLGLETMGGLVEKVIPRNSTIPDARAQEFTTFKDGQTAMSIHVLQGERELVSATAARWRASNCAASRRWWQVRRASASPSRSMPTACCRCRRASRAAASRPACTVKPSYGLSDDEITRMLKDAFTHAKDDMFARALNEQIVDAQGLIAATRAAMAADGALLDAAETVSIEASIAALEKLLSTAPIIWPSSAASRR